MIAWMIQKITFWSFTIQYWGDNFSTRILPPTKKNVAIWIRMTLSAK